MRYETCGTRLRKGFLIGIMSISILLSFTRVSLADENTMSGHEGMNMNGSSGHQSTPGMDPNMEGMKHDGESNTDHGEASAQHEQSSGGHGAASGGHGGVSGGHGESSGVSDQVNWAIVGGFSGINLLVIASAGILKLMKSSQV